MPSDKTQESFSNQTFKFRIKKISETTFKFKFSMVLDLGPLEGGLASALHHHRREHSQSNLTTRNGNTKNAKNENTKEAFCKFYESIKIFFLCLIFFTSGQNDDEFFLKRTWKK